MNAGPNAPDSPFMIWGESILRMPEIRLPKLPIKDPPFFLRPPLLRLRYAALAARAFFVCFNLRGMFTIVTNAYPPFRKCAMTLPNTPASWRENDSVQLTPGMLGRKPPRLRAFVLRGIYTVQITYRSFLREDRGTY